MVNMPKQDIGQFYHFQKFVALHQRNLRDENHLKQQQAGWTGWILIIEDAVGQYLLISCSQAEPR
jgi:hypothetical protein